MAYYINTLYCCDRYVLGLEKDGRTRLHRYLSIPCHRELTTAAASCRQIRERRVSLYLTYFLFFVFYFSNLSADYSTTVATVQLARSIMLIEETFKDVPTKADGSGSMRK